MGEARKPGVKVETLISLTKAWNELEAQKRVILGVKVFRRVVSARGGRGGVVRAAAQLAAEAAGGATFTEPPTNGSETTIEPSPLDRLAAFGKGEASHETETDQHPETPTDAEEKKESL